ncbi:MAG: Toluene efflux pump outer membrane protein TtgC [Burkholderia plantarii]|nr:MAG: Toluene efflux pump outer membrane protein TtgC [Burkholderia plantarii]
MRELGRLVLGALLAAALAGCTVGPDYRRPAAGSPAHWAGPTAGAPQPVASGPVAQPAEVRWWRAFGDAELTTLIARVLAARATRRMAGAAAGPEVALDASYLHARSSRNGLVDISGFVGQHDYNVWQSSLYASWELDLWGRVRRALEAADARQQAVEDWRRGVLLAVQAQTASDYIALRGVQAEQDIVRRNLDLARETERLTQIRFRDGVATRLEVAQASAQVKSIQASLPALERERAQRVNALSLMIGAEPRALEAELAAGTPIPPVPPAVPVGLPSELAERRPDIREAEARLHAATAEIGVAVADFYPRITLGASLDLQAMHAGDLGRWGSRAFGVGPALSLPLFEGGRLKGQLALSRASQQAAAVAYRRTVLNAWREVDDAMTRYRTLQQQRDWQTMAVEQNRIALAHARRQYVAGATDFLNVLSVQQSLLASERARVQSEAAVSASLVGMFKALGGGWQADFPAPRLTVGSAP